MRDPNRSLRRSGGDWRLSSSLGLAELRAGEAKRILLWPHTGVLGCAARQGRIGGLGHLHLSLARLASSSWRRCKPAGVWVPQRSRESRRTGLWLSPWDVPGWDWRGPP